MKTLRILLAVMFSLVLRSASGAGITIVTHGFQLTSLDHDHGWVEAMGDRFANQAGSTPYIYRLVVSYNSFTQLVATLTPQNGSLPPIEQSQNSEIVIKLYWDEVAGVWPPADTTSIGRIAYRSLTNFTHGCELPIQIIGHSRGASVASEMARFLGQRGIWVHQLTTLDPHPETILYGDAPVQIWNTVLVADNFYEDYILTQPNGQSIVGAYNENLTSRLSGGYGDPPGKGDHSDIHLWYHGTVNTSSGASDGEQIFTGTMRNTWYLPNEWGGLHAGFYYSRLGDGAYALDGFFNGYNDGGHNWFPDSRTSVTPDGPQWPSLIAFTQSASGSVQAGNSFPLEYILQSSDSSCSVTAYLDPDQNPYNGNEIALASLQNPQSSTGSSTRVVDVNGTVPTATAQAFYYVWAKITNTIGSRYLYARNRVSVTAVGTPAAPTITSVSPSTFLTSASQQQIKIYGAGFTNTSTLLFNGSIASDPARLTFVNANEIDYNIIVLSAGAWTVKVVNSAQQSNAGTFTVNTPSTSSGSLNAFLSPAGAVSAGAQWRADGGSYHNSGDPVISLTPGSHTVSFKSVSGYNTPASLVVPVVANAQTTVNAAYAVIEDCNYALSASGFTWAAAGGIDAFSVLTTAGCTWAATENLGWVSIRSGASGTGSHSIGYQVDYNPSTSPRSGVITAAGQYFNIYQNGNQAACTFNLSSPGANFTSGGGSGSFAISTEGICDWEATTNANWISITSAQSGTGSGSIQYAVQPNPGSSSRTGVINVGGQTFTIVQAGAPLPPGTIATGLSNPSEIALDDDFVYWIESRAKIVKRASKLGGQELLLASSSPYTPKGIAVDDSFVYYSDGNSQLFKAPKAGGVPVLLASSVSPERITLDATRVYWTEYAGNVMSVAKSGGAVTTEAAGTTGAAAIRVDGDAIYWSYFSNPGPLYKKLKSGGDKIPLYSFGDTKIGIALDTNRVFWTTSDAIWQISPDGSGRSAVQSGLRYVWDLAFDGANLFWTENTAAPRGTINQVLKQGGGFINLATNLAEPVSIAVDSQKVFWLERNGGTTGSGSLKWIAKGVVQTDTIAPQVLITNPPNAARFNDPTLDVYGIASDDTGVAAVEVRLNGGSWLAASGTTNWNLSVSLVVSTNTIDVRSHDNAGNYSSTATVTVTYIPPDAKLPQAIAFGALSRQVVGDAPFALAATASSGLPVTFSVLSGPAIMSGNILTMTGAGLVVLRASQSGDVTYNAAPNVDQVLLVVPGNNIITDFQRLANGMFTFRFYGEPGTNYVVQASTNLLNWLPLATNQITGLGYLEFTDASATNYNRRMYRIAPLSALTPSGPILTLMHVGNNVVVSWSTNDFGYTLESATNVSPTSWISNTPPPTIQSGQFIVTNAVIGAEKYFRLKR